jgi:hypothetical protein
VCVLQAIIKAFNASDAKWLAATTLRPLPLSLHPELRGLPGVKPGTDMSVINADGLGTDGRPVELGGYRPLDLEAPPFNLPPPVDFRPDSSGDHIKGPGGDAILVQGLGLWRLPLPPLAGWQE